MFLETLNEIKIFPEETKRFRDKAIKTGFPTRKTEAFSYLNLKPIEEGKFLPSSSGHKISFSTDKFEVLNFNEAKDKYGVFIFNQYEKMVSEQTCFFSLVNHGWGSNQYFIFIKESIEEIVTIDESFFGNSSMIFSSLHIFVAKDVKVCFHHNSKLEGGKNFINRSTHIFQEKNSSVTIYETSDLEKDNSVFFHIKVNLKKDSKFTHQSGSLGCKLFRNEIKAYLLEERASCVLEGFWNGANNFGIHHLVHCSHLARDTTSRQHYQGVCQDNAIASFEGQIYVDRKAQKTDSYQLSKHLLFGEKSKGFSKPNLEVFADDVKASHGATISMINEEELFYLKSRGIEVNEALALLKKGFLAFFLNRIENKAMAKTFQRFM